MKLPASTWKKRGLIVLSILLGLCLFSCVLILSVNVYVKYSVRSHILTAEEASTLSDVDCILILGAGIRGNQPSHMLADRLEEGIALYKSHASNKIIMSGDHGQANHNEVGVMKSFAINAGVPSEDIFMDHAGFSTYESMYRAKHIFSVSKIIVVTQDYHLSRALYIARALGLDAYGVSAKSPQYTGQAYRNFREILARNKDFFYCLFSPDPQFLGEAIPISGNGNLTNDAPF